MLYENYLALVVDLSDQPVVIAFNVKDCEFVHGICIPPCIPDVVETRPS
jgi:hypothetical protein